MFEDPMDGNGNSLPPCPFELLMHYLRKREGRKKIRNRPPWSFPTPFTALPFPLNMEFNIDFNKKILWKRFLMEL